MSSVYDGPYMDDWGGFFALVGVHRKLEFLRQWSYYTGMSLFDIFDGRRQEIWPNIRVVKCIIVDRDDPTTWDDETREAVDDQGGWTYEWDQFMRVDESGSVTATVFEGRHRE